MVITRIGVVGTLTKRERSESRSLTFMIVVIKMKRMKK